MLALLHKGQEQGVVVSHDSVWCTRGRPFPKELMQMEEKGALFDPTHFHRNIIPRLLAGGATQEQVDTMLIDNPKRLFGGIAR